MDEVGEPEVRGDDVVAPSIEFDREVSRSATEVQQLSMLECDRHLVDGPVGQACEEGFGITADVEEAAEEPHCVGAGWVGRVRGHAPAASLRSAGRPRGARSSGDAPNR